MMRICVKSLQGDEYLVDVQNDQSIFDLKVQISELADGLGVDRQKLIFKGRTMRDTCAVSEFNLQDGSKVHLIVQKVNAIKHLGIDSSSTTQNDATTTRNNNTSNIEPSLASASSTSSSAPEASDRMVVGDEKLAQTTTDSKVTHDPRNARLSSRFEEILRERLADHFEPDAVEKIMTNLSNEINSDINSSSLDDLEMLAKQKLNISNE